MGVRNVWVPGIWILVSKGRPVPSWSPLQNGSARRELGALWSVTLPFTFPECVWGFYHFLGVSSVSADNKSFIVPCRKQLNY